jgi:hypothetical protein
LTSQIELYKGKRKAVRRMLPNGLPK